MTFASTKDANPIRVLSDEIRILHRSSDSPSQMSVMVVDVPPGGAVPPHSHTLEEEGYFVLDGELTLTVGEAVKRLCRADFAHVPPQTVHAYQNASQRPVRFLAWTIGGPLDRFFKAMSERVKEMPRDGEAMQEIARQFGVRMVGGMN